jgi:5-(carboxyamino)imidazole ribonucleotide mutase
MKKYPIWIVIGSKSDYEYIKEGLKILEEFKINAKIDVISFHRTPNLLISHVKLAQKKGAKVFIAAAGFSAALPGAIASLTHLPVIGVPLPTSPLQGIDSLFSISQMPSGVPVGTMGIGKSGVINAIIFAIKILSLSDDRLKKMIEKYKYGKVSH